MVDGSKEEEIKVTRSKIMPKERILFEALSLLTLLILLTMLFHFTNTIPLFKPPFSGVGAVDFAICMFPIYGMLRLLFYFVFEGGRLSRYVALGMLVGLVAIFYSNFESEIHSSFSTLLK